MRCATPSRWSSDANAVGRGLLVAASRRVREECAGECRRVRQPGEDDGCAEGVVVEG